VRTRSRTAEDHRAASRQDINLPNHPAHWRTNGQSVVDSMIGDGVVHVRGSTASDIIEMWATF
jgi:hypothetical protein